MGPLVPDLISNELNFVVALIIGIAFGYILEQAGFSTSKKLVGLFYGYDFTVLRVFFTAGVTAMTGVIILTHFGMLDMSLVYVNPTFLYSALTGGLIMGLGFVIGGYCPGTSFCGAAIGKIDAMFFIAGAFLGVFAFAEFYPSLEGLYKAANYGNLTVFDAVGISREVFAFLMVIMALAAFYAVTLIETKVNNGEAQVKMPLKLYAGLASAAAVIGTALLFMPEYKADMLEKMNRPGFAEKYHPKQTSVDELAYILTNGEPDVVFYDLREMDKFVKERLPGAVLISPAELFDKETERKFRIKNQKKILYSEDELTARNAAALAGALGYNNVYYLEGGLDKFREEIIGFEMPERKLTRREKDIFRFRESAAKLLPGIISEASKPVEIIKKERKVSGGC